VACGDLLTKTMTKNGDQKVQAIAVNRAGHPADLLELHPMLNRRLEAPQKDELP